jgi:hypothetical protein
VKNVGVLILLLSSTSALAKECGEGGAKHWTTVVKTAAAPVTMHWTGVYEGHDSVCDISFSRTPGRVQTLSVWGEPQVNAAQSLIAFSSCADDGCDRSFVVADIAQGTVLKGMLPLPNQQLYFSVAWSGSERTLSVEVEGIRGQPLQHLTCSVSERIVCAKRGL